MIAFLWLILLIHCFTISLCAVEKLAKVLCHMVLPWAIKVLTKFVCTM